MEGGLLLDVVVRESSAIFELFSSENESLLLRRDSFLVLDLGLHVGDGVVWFDIQGNRLSGKGFDENLHGTTTETQHKVKSGLLLDVVIRKSTSVFELFSSEDQSLLLRRDSFLVLNFSLHVG